MLIGLRNSVRSRISVRVVAGSGITLVVLVRLVLVDVSVCLEWVSYV